MMICYDFFLMVVMVIVFLGVVCKQFNRLSMISRKPPNCCGVSQLLSARKTLMLRCSWSPGATTLIGCPTLRFYCVKIPYILGIDKQYTAGGLLLQWQPTGVEGGGERKASYTKDPAASYPGRQDPLHHRRLGRCLDQPDLDPVLGPGG